MSSLVDSLYDCFEQESTIDAESSYNFLRSYQFYKNWNVYDSDSFDLGNLIMICSLFCSLHGKVQVSSERESKLMSWSPKPLGHFRYRMTKENGWSEIGYMNKFIGYIVEGGYWSNGFFYRVMDKGDLKQLKLFVDDFTQVGYSYPETKRVSNLFLPL